jgi:pyruvate/2-oxoglutarate dehydrogenase complex dihydrolipoamide acyltransferase (E2) component
VSGLLDALLPPRQTEGLALETRQSGAETIFDLTVQDSTGRPQEAARIESRLLDPENQGAPLTFRQVGAGRYRAIAETDEPGVYLTQVAVLDEEGQAIGNLSSGVAVSYSPEYRPDQGPQGGADPLLGELSDTSAGRQSPPPTEAFAPTAQAVGVVQEIGLPLLWLALLLWPLDIASRRLLLRWSDMSFVRERLARAGQRSRAPRSTPAPAESTVARLQTARSRARPARAAPERQQPAEPRQPAPERQQPAAPRQPDKRPAPAPRPAEQRAAAQSGEDAVASLLAAKQRARRQRQRSGGEGQDDEGG